MNIPCDRLSICWYRLCVAILAYFVAYLPISYKHWRVSEVRECQNTRMWTLLQSKVSIGSLRLAGIGNYMPLGRGCHLFASYWAYYWIMNMCSQSIWHDINLWNMTWPSRCFVVQLTSTRLWPDSQSVQNYAFSQRRHHQLHKIQCCHQLGLFRFPSE